MKDRLKFISSLILFGSNGVIAAQIDLPSQGIVVLRTCIGALFLGLVFAWMRVGFAYRARACSGDVAGVGRKQDARSREGGGERRGPRFRDGARSELGISSRFALRWALASGIAMGLSWLFLYEAYRTAGVAISSLAYYCAPVLVMALSPVIFRERLTGRMGASFVVVLAGAVVLNAGAYAEGSGWGILCGGMSAVCHAAMVICAKLAEDNDGLANSLVQLVASFVVALAYQLGAAGPLVLPDAPSLAWAAVLGVVNTGLGCYLYFSSLPGLNAQLISVLGYLEPLSSVLFALVFLREPFGACEAFGALLIAAGSVAALVSSDGRGRQGLSIP